MRRPVGRGTAFGCLGGNRGIAGGTNAGANPNYPGMGLTEVAAMAICLAGGFGGLGRDAGGIAASLVCLGRPTGCGGNFCGSIGRPKSTGGRPEGRERKWRLWGGGDWSWSTSDYFGDTSIQLRWYPLFGTSPFVCAKNWALAHKTGTL